MTCPVCDRVQKSVRVNRERPPGDLKEGREPTVNPTLLRLHNPTSSSMLVTLDVLLYLLINCMTG